MGTRRGGFLTLCWPNANFGLNADKLVDYEFAARLLPTEADD